MNRIARHGQRTVAVQLRFWTDGIAKGKGKIKPRHAWGGGTVRVATNSAHEITPQRQLIFNSVMELPAIIERALVGAGISIHGGIKKRSNRLHRGG